MRVLPPLPLPQGTGHVTQAERLAAVVRRHGIPVLIVHGAGDALVPVANSRRLAALLPNAEVREVARVGVPGTQQHSGTAARIAPIADQPGTLLPLPFPTTLQLAVFERCGHMPQEECPERFVETVQAFVAALEQPPPPPAPATPTA